MKALSFYCLVHVSRLRVGMKKAPVRVLFLSAAPYIVGQWFKRLCRRKQLFVIGCQEETLNFTEELFIK
jgi:hypothetical protein